MFTYGCLCFCHKSSPWSSFFLRLFSVPWVQPSDGSTYSPHNLEQYVKEFPDVFKSNSAFCWHSFVWYMDQIMALMRTISWLLANADFFLFWSCHILGQWAERMLTRDFCLYIYIYIFTWNWNLCESELKMQQSGNSVSNLKQIVWKWPLSESLIKQSCWKMFKQVVLSPV